MIKAIIFDLDGTLLNRDTSVEKFIRAQYERLKEYVGNVPHETYISRFIELDCRGYVWKDKVYQQMVEEFEIEKISWEDLLEDYIKEFQYYCVPFPNLIKMLDELSGHFRLGMITNGFGQFQTDNIKALEIEHYFETILVSEWEGMKKPNPEIFKKAASKLNVSPSECLYVGDHPENDVKGAQNAGMVGVWKRDAGWKNVEADYIIDDLLELKEIVKERNEGHDVYI
ncbi:HAD family hydrolase [Lederbergia wuyishanensis]|uniref:Hydrolase of the HAD superfamily n=1 Tax=Lederbergia wuyishanensis TaxID=1347903 RepID=A0ABU0D259_9BACI|nr:HAD-IA family hydrolase [Lederbergia wuyishanensis]MCJ8007343.1 HAD-IA family hydrolase [Lederbergia wuyishanensis]MDQ0342491.1 putative hydrolase of the HAD superfamily [Lederbergia wuyishanensis]